MSTQLLSPWDCTFEAVGLRHDEAAGAIAPGLVGGSEHDEVRLFAFELHVLREFHDVMIA